jgi:hypothetical protein
MTLIVWSHVGKLLYNVAPLNFNVFCLIVSFVRGIHSSLFSELLVIRIQSLSVHIYNAIALVLGLLLL